MKGWVVYASRRRAAVPLVGASVHTESALARARYQMRADRDQLAAALVGAMLVLTAAIMCAGAASADPSQQDQFLALLAQEQIPPTGDGEVPGVVARAHLMCGELNRGTPVDTLVTAEINRAYADNPALQLYSGRVRRTAVRFITAAVDVYCPSHQGELPPYE